MTVCYNNYFIVISGILSNLKETPNADELVLLLINISDKWYDIGLSLQVHRNVLDDLKKREGDYPTKLNKVIYSWKDTQPSFVTWETIITAIESPIVNDKETADLIRQYLSIGKRNKLLLFLLSNEDINSVVQTTLVKCIQFSLSQHCSHTMSISLMRFKMKLS